VVVNLFFSMIELLKNDCIVSKLKKAVFVPPFLIVTYCFKGLSVLSL